MLRRALFFGPGAPAMAIGAKRAPDDTELQRFSRAADLDLKFTGGRGPARGKNESNWRTPISSIPQGIVSRPGFVYG